jgi:hypothetical protein
MYAADAGYVQDDLYQKKEVGYGLNSSWLPAEINFR